MASMNSIVRDDGSAVATAAQSVIRVLHVVRTPDLSAGGFVSYIDSLRAGLADHPVDLAMESVFPRNQSARVLAFKTPLSYFKRVQQKLAETDVLHVHGIFGWHVLLGVWAARRVGRPYVLTLHGHLHQEMMRERELSKRVYLKLIGNQILRDAAAIWVTAPAEAAIVRDYVPEERIRQIVPGLDVPATLPARPEADQADRPLRLFFIGRLHPHKGLRELLQALANARAAGMAVQLQVAGHGHAHELRRVQGDITRLNLQNHVELLGHIDPAVRDRLLAEADVLALPSRSENFGFAVAEALVAGVPVIVTEGVGLAAMVREWNCGTIIPVGDIGALTDALLAYRDPQRRATEGASAHAAAVACFSLSRMGAEGAAIYQNVATAHRLHS
jgi:glycosyltransferase involved in cell wall biosynthesis